MDTSTLYDAFQSISVDLDTSSVEVIGKLMEKQGIKIVNLEGVYYLKEDSALIEFNEITNIAEGTSSSVPRRSKLPQIANTIFVVYNIQNGDLNKACNHFGKGSCSSCKDDGITISANICKGLTIRYLFEKVKMLESEIASLKEK